MRTNNPEVRFKQKDGGDFPDWAEVKLGDIAEIFRGSQLSKSDLSKKGTPCILYGELYTKYKEVIKEIYSFTKKKSDNFCISNGNDVVIPSSGETAIDIALATSCVCVKGVILGGDLNIIRSDNNGIFLAYCIRYKNKEISKIAQGNSIVHLYGKQLTNINISIPCLEEQEKIAAFFSEIDSTIELEEKLLSNMKLHKTGMMQRMFSKSGESPEVRFKDSKGAEYPDWAKVKLGNIGEIYAAGDLDINLFSKYKTEEHIYFVYSNAITNKGLYGYYKKYQYDEDCVTITARGEIGFAISRNNKFFPIGRLITISNIKGNNIFLEYSINSTISFFSETTGVPQLTAVSAKNYKIFISCLEEQQKIAGFFSELDINIKNKEQKIKNIKEYKKGLMQKMFV